MSCATLHDIERLCFFCCLASMISIVSKFKISSLYFTLVAEQTVLYQTWSKTHRTGFLFRALTKIIIQSLPNTHLYYFLQWATGIAARGAT